MHYNSGWTTTGRSNACAPPDFTSGRFLGTAEINQRPSPHNYLHPETQSTSREDADIGSTCSSRTLVYHHNPSPLQLVSFPSSHSEMNNVQANKVSVAVTGASTTDIDAALPPRRTLPFESLNKIDKAPRKKVTGLSKRGAKSNRSRTSVNKEPTPPPVRGSKQGRKRSSSRAKAASQMTANKGDTQSQSISESPRESNCNNQVQHYETRDAACQADLTLTQRTASTGLNEATSVNKTTLWGILSEIREEQLKMTEALQKLKRVVQHLHVSPVMSTPADRRDIGLSVDERSQTVTASVSASQLSSEMVSESSTRQRRHTREYKEWRYYYLHACRVYETRKEKSDTEFIRRFLHEMPSDKVRDWIQQGLLTFYPSMVRIATTRNGSHFVITRYLTWAHVCEMATKKLRLPFPKWEMIETAV